jgi:two-component system, NarL family, response regulator LiaR
MAETIKVLIVDDNEMIREGIKLFLKTDAGVRVVGEGKNGVEAIAAVTRCTPDIVLMDVMMPFMDGITATLELKSEHPEVEVIMLTSTLDRDTVLAAVKAGAKGYLLKDSMPLDLLEAIHRVMKGEVQFHPDVMRHLTKQSPGLTTLGSTNPKH